MRNLSDKISYFGTMAQRKAFGSYFAYPNCSSQSSEFVDRKYLILELRRCSVCKLLFRSPTDAVGEGEEYYAGEYDEEFTTTLPDDEALQRLMEGSFSSTDGDYSQYIHILERLGLDPGSLVYDFGCSWGYGAFQLARAGYKVRGYEIAKHRRDYGCEKLGVRFDDTFPPPRSPPLDCFLCAHVLEHVPSVESVVAQAMPLLKPGGLFVSFTPNGSMALRGRWPKLWRKMWGRSHPNFLDDVFWRDRFKDCEYVITSNIPTDEKIEEWRLGGGQLVGRLNEWELLFAARKASSRSAPTAPHAS